MTLPGLIAIPLRLGLLVAGLIVPGTLLLRALRLPWSLASAFGTSVAVIYGVVLFFAFSGVPYALLPLASALVLVTLVCRLVPTRLPASPLRSSFACFSTMGAWLPLYAAFWLIVGYRLLAQPLSGPDVNFRWGYLAEQMVQLRTLDFYPPHRVGDFVHYFWAESIPPGVAGLYAWCYLCGGSRLALWTTPVVLLQLLALHELIWRLASRWGGEVVARRSVLLAAACPLLTWAVLIGQETGLIALAVAGIAWALHHLREKDGNRWAVLVAIFAIVASSTREYGFVFAAAATAGAGIFGREKSQVWRVALVALPVAAVWPAYVWALTGNPFYSLSFGGLLPDNPVFSAWLSSFGSAQKATLAVSSDWVALGRYLILWALPACVGAVALVALLTQRLKEAQPVAGLVVLVSVLWLASVSYTAGGLFYSLRVLAPAFSLLVVAAAYAQGMYCQNPTARRFAAMTVALVTLESLPKTLTLPENPYRVAIQDWSLAPQFFPAALRADDQALLAKVAPLPGRKKILSDGAGLPRLLAPIGSEVLPLWSPRVSWLFDERLAPREVARRWQQSGFRYLILAKSGHGEEFMRTTARWRAPYFSVTTAGETSAQIILEANVPSPIPP